MSVQAVISSLEMCTLNSCLATLLAAATAQLIKVGQSEFGGSLLLALIERGQKLVKSSREPEIQETNDYDKWLVMFHFFSAYLKLFVSCVHRFCFSHFTTLQQD